jgi:hypothetical protein
MINIDRLFVVQHLMKKRRLNNYLEIGVFNGHIFFRIKSNFKIAVDPDFAFDNARKFGKILLNPYNLYNRYFSKASDDFFKEDAQKSFSSKKIEIALIDGMHEYDFAWRDVQNTLRYLDDNGVIVLHDCNPQSAEAACSFEEWKARDFEGTWNGDVWKVILYLRSLQNDLNAFVLDCDHGLGIVTKGKNKNILPYSQEDIQNFTYNDFAANRKEWLNLKPAEYFYDFLEE